MVKMHLPNHQYKIQGTGYYVVSFSGGRSSGYMLHQFLDHNNGLPSNAKVVFCNTGKEHHATLDFVKECSQRWSVPIVWLEYD